MNRHRNSGQSKWANVQLTLKGKLMKRRRLGKLAGPLTKQQMRELGTIR